MRAVVSALGTFFASPVGMQRSRITSPVGAPALQVSSLL